MGTDSGNVLKRRSMVRVVAEARWSPGALLKAVGTPMRPTPQSDGQQDAAWVEEAANTNDHSEIDLENVDRPAAETKKQRMNVTKRLKITRNDLLWYGFTLDCPKCNDVQAGKFLSGRHHTDKCRYRLYAEFETRGDPKWTRARAELGLEEGNEKTRPHVPQLLKLRKINMKADKIVYDS